MRQEPLFIGIPEKRDIVLEFTVTGEPTSKSRARFTKRGSKTFAYTPEKTKQAEQRIAAEYLAAGGPKGRDSEIAYGVTAHFFNGTRQRRDVDNMVKLVLDALNGVAWVDDVQVIEIAARKNFVGRADARTEITVYQAGAVERRTTECARCGKRFETWPSIPAKHCSMECRFPKGTMAKERIWTCQGCGIEFSGDSHPRKYCTTECRYEQQRIPLTCDECGAEFKKLKCHIRATNYCSEACTHVVYRRKQKALGKGAGSCTDCNGPVSRKEYTRCRTCQRIHETIHGRPRKTALQIEEEDT